RQGKPEPQCNRCLVVQSLIQHLVVSMKVLHVVPGDSARGSLREALRIAGHPHEVLPCPDDLSCGPIAWGTSRERAAWWSHVHEPRPPSDFETFWQRLETTDECLVVWFGRHSASEFAFFLALANRLGDRPYDIVDVTEWQWPIAGSDGRPHVTRPA